MEHVASPDPVAHRFAPDRELLARAHNLMLSQESESHRFLRQRWEEGFAAVRVALDALREIYPSEREQLEKKDIGRIEAALDALTYAYTHLDDLTATMLGWPMTEVLRGHMTSHEEFDRWVEGR